MIVAAVLIALCVGSAFAVYSSNATPITVTLTASAPTTRTIYFTKPGNWGSVYAYVWVAETNTPEVAWPGTQMTYVGQNEYNEAVYSITFSNTCDSIIFHNNSGTQTVDIDLTQIGSANAYYVGDTTDGQGHLNC